ncbi:complement factor H-related protein 4 [Pteropus vampyrus]|uniref:Complement factor H-related protein 4 n=1 Tax=Pteropus vampyrus TaxID=132908 RepID=A0A6P6CSH2_PTEVA|nr:complement factor H-related protein 4 [Pteropus vampyrus]
MKLTGSPKEHAWNTRVAGRLGTRNMLLVLNVLLTWWLSWAHGQVKQCDIPKIKHGSLYRENVYRLYFPVTKYNSQFYFALEDCDVPVLENATVEITGSQFKFNDKLEYKCLDGFENRDGNTTGYIVCGEDGWSHLPTCYNSTEKCGPPPPISNGDVTSFLLTVYSPGSRVEYQCQAYYELGGSKYVTCSHAKWSELPRCIGKFFWILRKSES